MEDKKFIEWLEKHWAERAMCVLDDDIVDAFDAWYENLEPDRLAMYQEIFKGVTSADQ